MESTEQENSGFNVIKPGSQEWRDALGDVKALEDAGLYEGAKGTAVDVNVLTLRSTAGRHYTAHHGTQSLGSTAKIFVHFKGMVSADLEELGAHMLNLVSRTLNIPGTHAEAGPSPVFRNQFDFVLFEVPAIRLADTHRRIVESLKKTFG
jgi:hypothetical protein